MSDYIEREIDYDDEWTREDEYLPEYMEKIQQAVDAEVERRVAEAVKDLDGLRKVGRWEGGDYPYMIEITPLRRNEHYWYSCSICSCGQGYKTPYCPNCGARMEES